jgi:DNA polymerase III subunit alpha
LHAAGVAITADSIEKYVPTIRTKNQLQTAYDMDALAKLNVTKVDILGLATASIIRACEEATGERFSYRVLTDGDIRKRVLRAFRQGRTEGIFQFEKGGAKKIISEVRPTSFQDLMACNALNRPGPDVESFVKAKNGEIDHSGEPWYRYLADTYGAIVYQEQVMRICRAAGMEWAEADRVMKSVNAKAVDIDLLRKFIGLASKAFQIPKTRAESLYRRMTLYSFNKGHTAGYTLIGYYQMYFKLYYPLEFWWATLRYEKDDYKQRVYQCQAIKDGIVIFPPHVNGKAQASIEEFDSQKIIRLGLTSIKGVGIKAAALIEGHAPFKDDDDFYDRVPKRGSGKGISAALDKVYALDFNQTKNMARVVEYNSRLALQNLEVI